MKGGINLPRFEGEASRQAHADLPKGTVEREIGREGFYGPSTHMYHRHHPTSWSSFDGPLRPRAFDCLKLENFGPSPFEAKMLLSNPHVQMRLWRCEKAMEHLARNSDGDDLLFVHEGAGELYCDFGHLAYRDGDYILIPRGTMWRIEPSAPALLLMIEATNGRYDLPDKGIMGEHAIFDPAVLETPKLDEKFRAQQGERGWRVRVKRRGALSTISYDFNPLDAIGWKGSLAPVKLNWRDIRPLMSHRYHVPPSAHSTFVAERFVVCTFVPRPMESDPGALKIPFFHNNDDYDEVIFYHRGTFFSRDNIHPGMVTFHPAGFTHGPHPKAFAAGQRAEKKETDEVAVMLDARDALDVGKDAQSVEWAGYVDSWKVKA